MASNYYRNLYYGQVENNQILSKDYMNLKQENKHLNLQLDQALKDYEELLIKIDKAIEYIKENACYGIQEKCCLDDLNYDECDELLEILGDKE